MAPLVQVRHDDPTPAITLHADANGFRLSFRSVADFSEYSAVMAANLMHVRNNREAFAGMNEILDIQQAVNFQQILPSRGEQTNQPAKRLRQLQAAPPEIPTDPSSIRLLEICNKIPGTGQDRMGWQLSANQNFVFRLRPLLESYDELTNKALLRDHFEAEWSQDSNFYTIPELRGLEVRDEEGKLIPTWSATFVWASLYAMFTSLRNVIASSPGRMKSASEIPRKIPASLELLVPDSLLKIKSDYLLRLLRVPVSQLNMTAVKLVSQAVAAADQTANVQSVTLSSLSSSCKCLCVRFGHFADKLVRSEAVKTGVSDESAHMNNPVLRARVPTVPCEKIARMNNPVFEGHESRQMPAKKTRSHEQPCFLRARVPTVPFEKTLILRARVPAGPCEEEKIVF